MAYDERLAQSVRLELAAQEGVSEKRMFGGLAFMVRGNMALAIDKDRLMVRVGPDRYEAALNMPHAGPMDMTGRPMRGFVVVQPKGLDNKEGLQDWVQQGVEFALGLPPK